MTLLLNLFEFQGEIPAQSVSYPDLDSGRPVIRNPDPEKFEEILCLAELGVLPGGLELKSLSWMPKRKNCEIFFQNFF
jgi:hypothetical protein